MPPCSNCEVCEVIVTIFFLFWSQSKILFLPYNVALTNPCPHTPLNPAIIDIGTIECPHLFESQYSFSILVTITDSLLTMYLVFHFKQILVHVHTFESCNHSHLRYTVHPSLCSGHNILFLFWSLLQILFLQCTLCFILNKSLSTYTFESCNHSHLRYTVHPSLCSVTIFFFFFGHSSYLVLH